MPRCGVHPFIVCVSGQQVKEKVRGYKYGREIVPFPIDMDPEKLKFHTFPGMKLLGFLPNDSVPRHEFMASVDVVVAYPGKEESARALSAFIHGMHELNKVALVRYVKRANAAPLIGILIPGLFALGFANVEFCLVFVCACCACVQSSRHQSSVCTLCHFPTLRTCATTISLRSPATRNSNQTARSSRQRGF